MTANWMKSKRLEIKFVLCRIFLNFKEFLSPIYSLVHLASRTHTLNPFVRLRLILNGKNRIYFSTLKLSILIERI